MRMLRTLLCSDSRARYSKKHMIIPSLRKEASNLATCKIEIIGFPSRTQMAEHARYIRFRGGDKS